VGILGIDEAQQRSGEAIEQTEHGENSWIGSAVNEYRVTCYRRSAAESLGLSTRRNARCARSVPPIAAIAFAVDQQINRSRNFPQGPDIRQNTWYKRRPSNWRIDDGFEKKEGDSPRMVEEGYG
jgi:hypothetical protein